ncbi:pathogenesis-related protein 1-like [Gastrolobium bilobum]|uniref:pathogenesis-related protein 1-like n=1 Tax=Gastrolobium bilobum TaxID=150636 RepID=UPI002AB1105C|nr:pathogenesis-related protein 1-like [Gastrolobium bilobum]
MHPFFPFGILLLFLSTVSTQQQPPTTTNSRRGGGHGQRGGHHRGNPGKLFGYVRSNNPQDFNNHTKLAEEFLHAHNWVRNEYKLPPFAWDEKLASFARGYLMQRYNDCKMVHSTADYGENLFWGRKRHWTPSDAVYFWYREKRWYDFNTRKCASPPKMCDHFTQIVWRDSTRVGCALQHCFNTSAGMLVACEYDPPGNYVNENPLEMHI